MCLVMNTTGIAFFNFWFGLVFLGLGWNFMFVGATNLLTEEHRPEERRPRSRPPTTSWCSPALRLRFSSGALQEAYGWTAVNLAIALPMHRVRRGHLVPLSLSPGGRDLASPAGAPRSRQAAVAFRQRFNYVRAAGRRRPKGMWGVGTAMRPAQSGFESHQPFGAIRACATVSSATIDHTIKVSEAMEWLVIACGVAAVLVWHPAKPFDPFRQRRQRAHAGDRRRDPGGRQRPISTGSTRPSASSAIVIFRHPRLPAGPEGRRSAT